MKIAVLSSHTASLFWFRLDMMKEFINNGHKVIAVGSEPESDWYSKFYQNNIKYIQIYVKRNGINPIDDFKTFYELYRIIKKEKPDKIFTYQAKTIVYGCLAAKLNGIAETYPLIAGLGSIFRGEGTKNKIVKYIMQKQYRLACKYSAKVFFQNNDDKDEFINNNIIDSSKTVLINGSGVNLDKFRKAPFPSQPAFLFIGRLIKDKGVEEYLEASRIVKTKFPRVRFLLIGPFDSNPSALKKEDLQPYIDNGYIEYFGEQNDVTPFIAQCSTYVLPSYHEGTPKTVLEAMAMGRSIITTNAPGCKETVINGVNGYLVDIKDIQGIVDKMEYFLHNPDEGLIMGDASYKLAVEKYDVKIVNQVILKTMGLI